MCVKLPFFGRGPKMPKPLLPPPEKKAPEPEVNMGKGITSVTCPSCEKTHHVEENTTKFICSCGRRIRV